MTKLDIGDNSVVDGYDKDNEEVGCLWEGGFEYLEFVYTPKDDQSRNFIDDLSCLIIPETKRKNKVSLGFKKTVAAFVASLLRIEAKGKGRYGYHHMCPGAFVGLQVGYRAFFDVVQGMLKLGYIHYLRGYKEHSNKGAYGQATRFKATPRLIAYAAGYNIAPSNWKEHFCRLPRPATIRDPILLRTCKSAKGVKGNMTFNKEAQKVQMLTREVNEINTFFRDQLIENGSHHAFVRIFSEGNREEFDWNKGGRLYSVGGNNYQNMEKELRPLIRINGEATVELDIKSSFITILSAKLGYSFSEEADPYAIAGLPREIVKTFVNMALGYDRFHKRWPKSEKQRHAKEHGNLDIRFPPAMMREKVLSAMPAMRDWESSDIGWSDLHYIESCAMIEAVRTLALVHGVAALPVHDSIIVPVSGQALAEETLADAFLKHVGVRPTLSQK